MNTGYYRSFELAGVGCHFISGPGGYAFWVDNRQGMFDAQAVWVIY